MSGYVSMQKHDYEKIITLLRYQQHQITELQKAKEELLLSEDEKLKTLRQKNKDLSTQLQAKRNLHQLLYEKSTQLTQFDNDLKLAQLQLNNCKTIIEKLGGSFEESFKGLSLEDTDADSDTSFDLEGEDVNVPEDEQENPPTSIVGGVSREAFDGVVRESEARQQELTKHQSKIKEYDDLVEKLKDELVSTKEDLKKMKQGNMPDNPQQKLIETEQKLHTTQALLSVLKSQYTEVQQQNQCLETQLKVSASSVTGENVDELKKRISQLEEERLIMQKQLDIYKEDFNAEKKKRIKVVKAYQELVENNSQLTDKNLRLQREVSELKTNSQMLHLATGGAPTGPNLAHLSQMRLGVVQDGPPSIPEGDPKSDPDSGLGTMDSSGASSGYNKLGPLDCPNCYRSFDDKHKLDAHISKCI